MAADRQDARSAAKMAGPPPPPHPDIREPRPGQIAAQRHVVAGQRWRSKDPRDDGLTATVLSTSGPGGFVYIQRFRKSRVRFERFVRDYELVQA